MKRRYIFLLWFLFLGTFGFAGGGYFLLFFIVPFEDWLGELGLVQSELDNILKYFVYGWVILSLILSFLFYFVILRSKRIILSCILVAFTTINASIVFYQFMNTDSAIITMSRGELVNVNERVTFGPYPELEVIEQLEREGFDGIITLLSPTFIFEQQLLKKQFENARKAGIEIYSFPMLPWVGDNQKSLDGIIDILNNNPEKRFYINCYLGKHRVDLVKQIMEDRLEDEEAEEELDPSILMPLSFERGNVYPLNKGEIMIGPYPTDEEWFTLIRYDVKEIISLLDPTDRLFEKEVKIARESGIRLTNFSLDEAESPTDQLKSIVNYLKKTDHKVYIHDFNENSFIRSLKLQLQTNSSPIDKRKLAGYFNGEVLYEIDNIVLGPQPKVGQLAALKNEQINKVISYGDTSLVETKELGQLNIAIQVFPAAPNYDERILYQFSRSVINQNEPVYIYGLDDKELSFVYSLLERFTYGVSGKVKGVNQAKNDQIQLLNRRVLVGPELKDDDQGVVFHNGITKVIIVYASSLTTENELEQQKRSLKNYGVQVDIIPMYENYLESLVDSLSMSYSDTTYISIPNELSELLITNLTDIYNN